MVPEILSVMDRIFVILDHFLTFCTSDNVKNQNFEKNEKNTWRYYHFTHVYHKWESYDIWFLRYVVWRTEFFVILDRFSSFYLPNNPENQNFEKLKRKTHLEISSFDNSVPKIIVIMVYYSWDMACNRCNYFSFWAIFCTFTSLKIVIVKA